MEEIQIYNNDLGTFLILFIFFLGICYTLCFMIDNDLVIVLTSFILVLSLFLYSPDSYRVFQTVYKTETVIVKKIFSHDTRKLQTIFNFNVENGFRMENYQTGNNKFYFSAKNGEMYTIQENLVPLIIHNTEPTTKILIKSWKYTYNDLFEIYNFKNE